jgi:hypothetical protein
MRLLHRKGRIQMCCSYSGKGKWVQDDILGLLVPLGIGWFG